MQRALLSCALFTLSSSVAYSQMSMPTTHAAMAPAPTAANKAPAVAPSAPVSPLASAFSAVAASAPAGDAKGKPQPNGPTYIWATDVQDVLKDQPTGDHDLKSVDIGKLNLSVGVVSHHKEAPSADGSAGCILHHGQTEAYVVIEGSGTLVTSTEIYDAAEAEKTSTVYTTYNGPSTHARIKTGERHVVHVGDVVIIPPEVCHGWADVPESVVYLTVRPDPERSLPIGYVNPHIKK